MVKVNDSHRGDSWSHRVGSIKPMVGDWGWISDEMPGTPTLLLLAVGGEGSSRWGRSPTHE